MYVYNIIIYTCNYNRKAYLKIKKRTAFKILICNSAGKLSRDELV